MIRINHISVDIDHSWPMHAGIGQAYTRGNESYRVNIELLCDQETAARIVRYMRNAEKQGGLDPVRPLPAGETRLSGKTHVPQLPPGPVVHDAEFEEP